MSIAIKRNFTIPSTSSIGASEISLSSSTASTSVNTGAIVSLGGAGISGAISLGGPLKLYNGSYYTGFDSAATANTTYIWPATSPSTGTSVLSSDAAGNLSWILMSASGSGFTLNGLDAPAQYFSTSISGSGFTISSVGSTHTFHIGLAGSASTGLISGTAQTIAGQKTFTSTIIGDLSGTATTATTSQAINTVAASTNATHYVLFSPTNGGSGVAVSSDTGLTFNPSSNLISLSTLSATTVNSNTVNVTGSTASTSSSTGSLIITGGAGVGGSLWTSATNFSSISGVGHSNGVITSGVWSGTAISVVNGGTGLISYTTGDILYASSSSSLGKITAGSAGSILTSAGAGSTPYWSAPAATGVTSLAASTGISVNASTGAVTVTNTGVIALTGTANQVLVNGGSGSATSGNITLTTPQSIGTASSPSFADISLTTGSNSTLAAVGSAPTSIVNKQYVDNLASGLDIHGSVRVIQTSSIGASYIQIQSAGSASTGSYLISITQVALPSIDGVTFSATGITQRVLINGGFSGNATIGGTTPFTPGNSNIANGIYYVGALGGAGTSNWILVRATDTDDSAELTGGTFTFVEEGTTYADSGWVCSNDTTNLGPILFGNTAIIFTQFTGSGALSVGQGLNKVSNTIAAKINISSIGTPSGTGYTQFNLGGTSGGGTADTGYYPTFGIRTSGTIAGSAILTLNSDGFSLIGSTNLNRTITITGSDITLTGGGNTLTLTGSISLPSPTTNGIAYGSSSSAVSFLTASGSGASVLTQTSGSAPVYFGQSQLIAGGATTSARWQTSRTVTFSGGGVTGSFSIDGSANVSGIALTVTDDSIALGTKTTGQYASTIAISGSGITATSSAADDGTAYTIYSSAVSTNTASSIVLRDSSGNFSAGTITGTLSGTATSAVNAGFAGAATTANSAGSAGTSVNSGFAGAASTATNAGFAGSSTNSANTNITLDTASTIYLTGSRSNASIGSTPVYVLSGVSALGNTITATTFSGTATSAVNAGFSGAATTATNAGSAGTAVNAGLSSLATNLAGGTIGALHYQSASNASGFISYPGAGYALTSVGAGTSSVWQLLSAMTVGSATTATNAGFAGAATTATSAGSAGTAINAGFAGAATTATNAGFAGSSTNTANANIVLDTTSTIYLTGSRSNASIGSTPVYVLSGVSALGNTITATTFSGSLSGIANSASLINVSASTGTRYLAGFSLNTATGATQLFTGSGITIGDNRLTTGGLAVTSGTASTSTLTGALTVAGGVGITGQLSVNTIALGTTGVSGTPTMIYTGTAGTVISMSVLSDTTLTWEGSSGQLFSIDNNLSSGEIFSVSDISGLPVITASAGQTVTLNEFGGYTQVGNGLASTSTTTGALRVIGGVGITGAVNIAGNTSISSSTASTNTTTGALVVTGGVGVGASVNIAGNTIVSSSTASTSTSTGSLVVSGGVGIGASVNVAGNTIISSVTASTSTSTGALVVTGGAGIGGTLNIGGNIRAGTNTFSKSGIAAGDILLDNGTVDTPGLLFYWGNNRNMGIDTYYGGTGATRIRIVKELNESGGSELWSVDRTGVVTQTAWAPGEIIKTTVLVGSDLTGSNPTTINSTSDTDVASYSYTPVSSSSYILIEFQTRYTIAGAAEDNYISRIAVDGAEQTYGQQYWINGAGGGTRSGVLFPLMARYTNSNTSAKTISVTVRRGVSDDNATVQKDSTTVMKITEIGR